MCSEGPAHRDGTSVSARRSEGSCVHAQDWHCGFGHPERWIPRTRKNLQGNMSALSAVTGHRCGGFILRYFIMRCIQAHYTGFFGRCQRFTNAFTHLKVYRNCIVLWMSENRNMAQESIGRSWHENLEPGADPVLLWRLLVQSKC